MFKNYMQVHEWDGMKELPVEWWPDVGQTPSATAAGDKGACKIITGTDRTQVIKKYIGYIFDLNLTYFR